MGSMVRDRFSITADRDTLRDIEGRKPFSDSLDVMQFLASVHSRIGSDISSDFVLAKLEDGDKEFIIEMIVNAYFVKRLMKYLENKAESEADKERLKEYGQDVFDAYANKLYMIALVNRNVPLNALLRLMAGLSDIEQEEMAEKQVGKLQEIIQKVVRRDDKR